MKSRILLFTVLLAVAAGTSGALAQTKRNRVGKEFMRAKLELSQRLLEGLATEDYELLVTKGTRLSAMSREAGWRVFENPDYDQQSVTFRRQVDSLVRAAKDKNLDTATLAYVRLTMSCVDCHKLLRGKLSAAVEGFVVPPWATGPRLAGLSVKVGRPETAGRPQAWRSALGDESPRWVQ